MRPGNARFNVMNAAIGAVAINLMHPYVKIFAIKLGATNLQLGYLSSWPQIASVIAVLGAASAVARSPNKQRLIAGIFLLGRAAALGAAAVPWFPESWRIWTLIGFWVLTVFPNSAAGTALQSFLADVFPENERTRAFASRNSWATAAGMAILPLAGLLLDRVFPYPAGYQIVFALSFAVALIEIYYFLRLKEAPPDGEATSAARVPGAVGWRTYLETMSHKPFLAFLLCSIPFHFTWQMAWPIFDRYQVTDLAANNTWLNLITVANSLTAMLSYPVWARLADRYGNSWMMGWTGLHLATAPFLTALAPSIGWMVPVNLFTGASVAGVTLLVLNNLLEVSPAAGRPVYLAVHAALVSVSASIAPLVGAVLIDAMGARNSLFLASIPRVLTALMFFYLVYRQRGKGIGTEAAKVARPSPAASAGAARMGDDL